MAKFDKTELFETVPVPKAVAKLAIPSVAATLVMALYSLADTYFVGLLNNPIETAAVTFAAPVILAFNAVNNLFGVGCSSKISRALGEKDYESAKVTAAFGFYGAIISGLIFSLVITIGEKFFLNLLGAAGDNITPTHNYLFWTVMLGAIPAILNVVMAQIVKSEGSAMHAAIGTMSGCLLNVVLDPVFILPWGLNMGAAGAGCATFISNCVACLYYVVYLIVKRKTTIISINPKDFRPNVSIVKDVCGVGIPASVQNLLNVTGMTILNNLMAQYGSEAVSAIGIAHKMALIPMYIAMGMSQGVMPLVGYNFAAENRKRMNETISFTFKLAAIITVVATLCYYIFAGDIVRLFMTNEKIVEYGTVFLRAQALAIPFLNVDFLAVGVFQACGMGKRSLVFAILRKIVLEIPAMIVLNHFFPMYGLAYAQLVSEVVLCVAGVVMMERMIKDGAGGSV